ncbi:MAG TPA: sorbosone dehydrogenase family protein [Ignavibacteriaceae bacterium]|nr:sorbosone dehydrogenase family protein [Ignavibacteriaceae bacterium]
MKNKMNFMPFIIYIVLFIFSFGCNPNNSQIDAVDNMGITLPAGFHIGIYADNIDGARSMALSPNGTLFIGSLGEGKVYAVLDTNKDYNADEIITIASGLNSPNGVAFRNGSLYVAEINRVLRYDNIEANLRNAPQPFVVNNNFPSDAHHGWKFIRFGPDGKLYVPVGAPCNICERPDPYESITRMNPDGSEFEIYARGIRNTVGFDWDPRTEELWFTDNGRDMLGDEIPPDELNHAPQKGMNFGFPYFYGKNIPNPEFANSGKNPSNYTPTAQDLGPHVASLGMRFYTGSMFPAEYKNQIFIAEHGSWNRSKKIGYRVTLVKLGNNKPVSYSVFAEGWLKGESVSGRPVDLQIMPDGSMLVSDDYGGRIYRISYSE